MDDRQNILDNELEEVIVTDESDASGETKEISSDLLELNQDDDDLNVEMYKSQGETPQQKAARLQQEAWTKKVLTGKAQLEDVPNWLHGKVKAAVDVAVNTTPQSDMDAIIEQKLAQKLEDKEFMALKDRLKGIAMSKQQAEILKTKFSEFKKLGNLSALQNAIAFAQINLDQVDNSLKNSMGLPKASNVAPKESVAKKIAMNDPKSIAEDDSAWKAYLETPRLRVG